MATLFGNKVTSATLSSSSSLVATLIPSHQKYLDPLTLNSVSTLNLYRTSSINFDWAALGLSMQQTYTISLGSGFMVDADNPSILSQPQTITFNTYPTVTNFYPTNGSRDNTYIQIMFDRPINFKGSVSLYKSDGTLLKTISYTDNSTQWNYVIQDNQNYGIKLNVLGYINANTGYYITTSANWMTDEYNFYAFQISTAWTSASSATFPDLASSLSVGTTLTARPRYVSQMVATRLSATTTATINARMIHNEFIVIIAAFTLQADYKRLFLPRLTLNSSTTMTTRITISYGSTLVRLSASTSMTTNIEYKPIIPSRIGTILDPIPTQYSSFGAYTKMSQNYILISAPAYSSLYDSSDGKLYLYSIGTNISTPFGTLIYTFNGFGGGGGPTGTNTSSLDNNQTFDINNQFIIIGGSNTVRSVGGNVQIKPNPVYAYNITTMINNINNNIPITNDNATYTLPPADQVFTSNGYFILVRTPGSKQTDFYYASSGVSNLPTTLEVYSQNTGNLVNTINLPTFVSSQYDSLAGQTIYTYYCPIRSYEVVNDSITMLAQANPDIDNNYTNGTTTIYYINNVATDTSATVKSEFTNTPYLDQQYNLISTDTNTNKNLTIIANGNNSKGTFGLMKINSTMFGDEDNQDNNFITRWEVLDKSFNQPSPQLGDAKVLSDNIIVMGISSASGITPKFLGMQSNINNVSINTGIAIWYDPTRSFISFIGANSDYTGVRGTTGTSISKWNDGSNGNFSVSTTQQGLWGDVNFVSIYNITI